LQQHDFTLILMDVQMPDMNGFETATLIYERERLRHIPIIFITAHNHDEEYMFRGYQMGGVDYIYKPINSELLRAKVSVFVELYRKTHQLIAQERKLLTVNKSLEREIEERKITEEKIRLLNQQLVENNNHLKSINEELDRFAYVASHDLQEPLRKILVFSDKIGMKFRDNIPPEMELYLQKIAKASERMQTLIHDLLKFSRHTSSEGDFGAVDLRELLDGVLSDMEVEIENKKAVIQVDGLPVIWAISSQIRQLFQNLLSNSLKFCRENSTPVIHIFAELHPGNISGGESTAHYRIYFRDNGIGFDQKYADDIFMVFKRLHSYHEFEGTGVGLSICKKIVERHRGFIEAVSKPGEGSTFVISLPEHRGRLAGIGMRSLFPPMRPEEKTEA
ncbi:MAG TPA: ATP-binding protein, partial [Chitinophagaceae bacterium]|nr:ATP-binding protein [Chitinophagaceae bacterium]